MSKQKRLQEHDRETPQSTDVADSPDVGVTLPAAIKRYRKPVLRRLGLLRLLTHAYRRR